VVVVGGAWVVVVVVVVVVEVEVEVEVVAGARVVVAGTAVVVTGGEVVVVVAATGRPDKAVLDRSGGEQAEATSSRATPAEGNLTRQVWHGPKQSQRVHPHKCPYWHKMTPSGLPSTLQARHRNQSATHRFGM
jgi:hypothetical protein